MKNRTKLLPQQTNTKKILSLSSVALTGLILSHTSFAALSLCQSARVYTDVDNQTSTCACFSGDEVVSEQTHHTENNTFISSTIAKKCADSFDMTCAESPTQDLTYGTHYFKHTGGGGYYRCDWSEGVGFSNAKLYMPPPPAPETVQAIAISSTQIALTWKINKANRVQTGFKIESPDATLIHTTARMDTRYEHSDLKCDTTYDYVIKATNIGGNSIAVAVSATTLPCSPSAPEELTANAISPEQIDLSWTDTSDNEEGFKVENATGSLIYQVDADEETYSHTDLSCGTTYDYVIKASNAHGDSEEITASATTWPCPVLPPPPPPIPVDLRPVAPTNLVATAISATQIDLSWTDQSENETGFILENQWGTWIDTTPANLTHYRHTDLICDTTYHYVVKATNDDGDSTEITAQAHTAACQVIHPSPTPNPPPVELPPTVQPSIPVGLDTDKRQPSLAEESGISTVPALPVETEPPPFIPPVVTEPVVTEEESLPTVSEENPVIPEISTPEIPEMVIPEISTPEIPEMVIPEVSTPEIPEMVIPEVSTPEIPETVIPEVSTPKHIVQTLPVCKSQPVQKISCNAYWQNIHTDLITKTTTVADVIFSTPVENNGWLINAQLTETALLIGGKLSGTIVNSGIIRDAEFVGKRIQGGYLGGFIQNNSRVAALITDVHFEPNSLLMGGYLSGVIQGDPVAPALLQGLTVLPKTQLSHVILGDNVVLDPSVVIGVGVRFARDLSCGEGKEYAYSLFTSSRSDSCLKRLSNWVQLTVSEAHRGQRGDIVFSAVDRTDKAYTFDGHDWYLIAVDTAELTAAMSFEQLPLTIEFDLPKISHFKTVHIGYRLENGEIIYWRLK
ncbi:fibronectin type III domain-containing protein [Thioflexithrix psekupsensis]|uniref:Fibronectin type-III domain-containing protein n=1 Tax=Thioflexithrix psekupsensis TaxID=1570016 RepID=A0A251XCB1_9GAMM|nr:hypothetical protein [Thioflexithrix psekupsensis]OUD15686.1 hypothetical protein TPSD3_04000 [Thioflexithrix psekupsensis]